MLQWIFNPTKLRYDFVDLADGGKKTVIQTIAHPNSKVDDLGKGVLYRPMSDSEFAIAQRAAKGDAQAQQAAYKSIQQYDYETYIALGGDPAKVPNPQGNAQEQDETRGVLPSNEVWQALNRSLASGMDIKDAVFQMGQNEYTLAQDMRNKGQDPAYWFGRLNAPFSVQGVPGQMTINNLYDPNFINNMTDTARAATRAALQVRAQQLQTLTNQWQAHQEGTKRMNFVQSSNLDIGDMERQYKFATDMMMRNPGNDKSLRQVQNPDGTTTSVYESLYPQYEALIKAKRERDRQTAVWWPDQYVQGQQQNRSQNVWNGLSQAQRAQMFGDEASYKTQPTMEMRNALLPRDNYVAPGITPVEAAPGPVKYNVLPRLSMGGRVPRFSEGGEQIGTNMFATMSEQQRQGQIELDAIRQSENMQMQQFEIQRQAMKDQFTQQMATIQAQRAILVQKIQMLTQPENGQNTGQVVPVDQSNMQLQLG